MRTKLRVRWCGAMSLGAVLAVASCAPAGEAPVAQGDQVAAAPATTPARVPLTSPAVALPPTPGAVTRWQADGPLRAGMARVRAATGALAHAEHRHLDRAQELALADEIQGAVNAMFAQCKLAPAPDAALHPLLARLLATTRELRARRADPAMVAELRAILGEYNDLFEETPG